MSPQQARALVGQQPELKCRYELKTHYIGGVAPTVLHFDTADEVYEAAAHRHKCHTGVSHTIIRQVPT